MSKHSGFAPKRTAPTIEMGAIALDDYREFGFSDNLIQEMAASCIPPDLVAANIAEISTEADATAVLENQWHKLGAHSQQFVTQELGRYLRRWVGGWYFVGDLEDPYIKPGNPIKDSRKAGKLIKYENFKGCEGRPLFPVLTFGYGIAIAQQCGLEGRYLMHQGDRSPDEIDSGFWEWVGANNVPISITEGLKKALALVAQGRVAIALRGVTMWRQMQTQELHPSLLPFATQRRAIRVVFDQDDRPATRRNVDTQIRKLGDALATTGASVLISQWDKSLGKGIDDVLASHSGGDFQWLALSESDEEGDPIQTISLKRWKRDREVARCRATIESLTKDATAPTRATRGGYVPSIVEYLPRPGGKRASIALSAGLGAGKTQAVGELISTWRDGGGCILALAPTNGLGKQSSQRWDLPHVHDYALDRASREALAADVSHRRGIVCCPDSLLRVAPLLGDRPLLVVLDEGNAVIRHIIDGQTLGNRWHDITRLAAKLMQQAQVLVAAEAELAKAATDFLRKQRPGAEMVVIRHERDQQPWECRITTSYNGWFSAVIEAAAQGRIAVPTTSQRAGRELHRILQQRYPDKAIHRVDSQTNEAGRYDDFFDNPDAWLESEKPDVLIFSPSVQSGVSIQGGVTAENSYFAAVWQYAPSLTTDSQMQLAGRIRPSVPRFICVPEIIQGGGSTHWADYERRWERNWAIAERVHGVENNPPCAEDVELNEAIKDFHRDSEIVGSCQKRIARLSLEQALASAGHVVISGWKPETMDGIKSIRVQAKAEIWAEDGETLASAELSDSWTVDRALDILKQTDTSRELRIKAEKVLLKQEFPGVDFDDPAIATWIYREWGKLLAGLRQEMLVRNPEAARAADAPRAKALLSDGLKAPGLLPTKFQRSRLMGALGLLELIDSRENYTNSSPLAIAVKQNAIRYAKDVEIELKLHIKAEQTPVEIINKLLKRIGLKGVAVARPGRRGEQKDRVYRVEGLDDPIREKLANAWTPWWVANPAYERGSAVSTISIRDSNEIVDTKNNTTSDSNFEAAIAQLDEASRVDFLDMWRTADDDETRQKLLALVLGGLAA